jgi:ABC-type multidrug transport system ATPase subunit
VNRQPWDARALVRLTSNDARAIHRRSTLRETVLASLVPAGRGRSEVEARASGILDRLGLSEGTRISSWPGSAWTWIRLSLAIALVSDPKVVLLDEPAIGLDETDARTLMGMLAELGRAAGKTVVVATRQVGLVREYCDRVIVLDRGRIAFDCRAPDLRRVRLADVYRITVGGQLDDAWSDWFDGMRIATTDAGATVLTGPVPDQSALHGLLTKVRDLGLPLLALCRVEPDARDVLNQLGGSGGRIEEARRLSRNGRLG